MASQNANLDDHAEERTTLRRILAQPHTKTEEVVRAPTDPGIYILWVEASPAVCLKVGIAGPRKGGGVRERLALHVSSNPTNSVLARHMMADSRSTWTRQFDFRDREERRRFLSECCYFQVLPLPQVATSQLRVFERFLHKELKPVYQGRVGESRAA